MKAKGVQFPVFAKTHVNGGDNEDPLYTFLKHSLGGYLSEIKWNFGKFLVGADGVPVKRYAPITSPLDLKLDIEALLA